MDAWNSPCREVLWSCSTETRRWHQKLADDACAASAPASAPAVNASGSLPCRYWIVYRVKSEVNSGIATALQTSASGCVAATAAAALASGPAGVPILLRHGSISPASRAATAVTALAAVRLQRVVWGGAACAARTRAMTCRTKGTGLPAGFSRIVIIQSNKPSSRAPPPAVAARRARQRWRNRAAKRLLLTPHGLSRGGCAEARRRQPSGGHGWQRLQLSHDR